MADDDAPKLSIKERMAMFNKGQSDKPSTPLEKKITLAAKPGPYLSSPIDKNNSAATRSSPLPASSTPPFPKTSMSTSVSPNEHNSISTPDSKEVSKSSSSEPAMMSIKQRTALLKAQNTTSSQPPILSSPLQPKQVVHQSGSNTPSSLSKYALPEGTAAPPTPDNVPSSTPYNTPVATGKDSPAPSPSPAKRPIGRLGVGRGANINLAAFSGTPPPKIPAMNQSERTPGSHDIPAPPTPDNVPSSTPYNTPVATGADSPASSPSPATRPIGRLGAGRGANINIAAFSGTPPLALARPSRGTTAGDDTASLEHAALTRPAVNLPRHKPSTPNRDIFAYTGSRLMTLSDEFSFENPLRRNDEDEKIDEERS